LAQQVRTIPIEIFFMMQKNIMVFGVTGLFLMTGIACAHHSFAAHFVVEETVVIEGVVKEWWFQNPHTRIYLDVTNDEGEITEWMAEGSGPNVLARRGWTKETIKVGTFLTISGNPARNESNSLHYRSLKTADGKELNP
tara:strand:+ start:8 stop:424 length:417 start_codon:yes stop_codon:yes gene_type:complete